MRYNVRHTIITRGSRLVSDNTVETTEQQAREYGNDWFDGCPVDMEVRVRDGGVAAYRWSWVGSDEVHTVVFWPLADGSDVGDGYPYGIAATFRMSAVTTGEPKKMIHPSGATGSTDETGALDRLLYAVGRACEPLGTFGETKTDERRAAERITAEALVQFAHETGAVTAVDGEQIGGPSRLLQVLIEMCGGYR